MDKKVAVTAADLFVLLDREFRRRSPRECAACFIELPYRIEPRAPGDPNWEAFLPRECGKGCADLAEEIVSEMQRRYALRPSAARRPRPGPGS